MENKKPERSRVSIVLWCVLGAILLLIVVMLVFKKRPEDVGSSEEEAVPVKAEILAPRDIPDIVSLSGRLEPFIEADLAVEKSGRAVELKADKGDRVKAGDVLLRLDVRLWKALLKKAEIEYRDAKKEIDRWQELKKTGSVSESGFDAVNRRWNVAEVSLEEAKVQLSQCDVRSPIDGVVDARYIEEGEYAAEGAPVFKVVDVDKLKLIVDVPEKDIASVSPGDAVRFRILTEPSAEFSGKVTFVPQVASSANNAFRTEILVDNRKRKLRSGMIAEVDLDRGLKKNALVLPLAVIVPEKGEHIVFVVEGGRAVRRAVKIERIVEHEALLSSGVEANDEVVVEGHRALRDGMPVEVREAGPEE